MRQAIPRAHRSRRRWQVAILAGIGIATLSVVMIALRSAAQGDGESAPASIGQTGATAPAVPRGPQSVAGLEVEERLADLGRVPMNTPVRREWVLTNRGTSDVTLAQPTIEVLEGC